MKITTIFLGSALVASSLFAADNLAKAAKDAGLVALLQIKQLLLNLRKRQQLTQKIFQAHLKELNLVKNYFLNLCFQKVELYHVIPVTI